MTSDLIAKLDSVEVVNTTLEVVPDAIEVAVRVFLEWSGGSVSVYYTPDVLLAVDSDSRRGFLLDEIYVVSLWADRGVNQLFEAVADALGEAGYPSPNAGRPEVKPLDIVSLAVEHGSVVGSGDVGKSSS